MNKVRVAVAGYGVIGTRLADAVAMQEDMELVGVVDAGATLAVRSLKERGMPYDLYSATVEGKEAMEAAGLPVKGMMEDILQKVDVVLDASPGGIGAKNKELYLKHNVKAVFQGARRTAWPMCSSTAMPTMRRGLTPTT